MNASMIRREVRGRSNTFSAGGVGRAFDVNEENSCNNALDIGYSVDQPVRCKNVL